jgi:hypothetical protein
VGWEMDGFLLFWVFWFVKSWYKVGVEGFDGVWLVIRK